MLVHGGPLGPRIERHCSPGVSPRRRPKETLASLCLPTQAALQWEHWFCCGGFFVGVVRQTLRLCLLARSNLGYPYIPREYRTSSRGRAGAVRHEPPGHAKLEEIAAEEANAVNAVKAE